MSLQTLTTVQEDRFTALLAIPRGRCPGHGGGPMLYMHTRRVPVRRRGSPDPRVVLILRAALQLGTAHVMRRRALMRRGGVDQG